MHSEYEGHVLRARLTYQFNLALHEGQNLTCVYHYGHGSREEKSIPIPRYCEFYNSHVNTCIIYLVHAKRRFMNFLQTSPL